MMSKSSTVSLRSQGWDDGLILALFLRPVNAVGRLPDHPEVPNLRVVPVDGRVGSRTRCHLWPRERPDHQETRPHRARPQRCQRNERPLLESSPTLPDCASCDPAHAPHALAVCTAALRHSACARCLPLPGHDRSDIKMVQCLPTRSTKIEWYGTWDQSVGETGWQHGDSIRIQHEPFCPCSAYFRASGTQPHCAHLWVQTRREGITQISCPRVRL
jgi:hypothetical protein